MRDSGGHLKLIVWDVLQNGYLTRLGDSAQQGEAASLIALAGGGGYLITAIRDSNGKLKLISWKISPDGKTVTRISDSANQAGAVDGLSCVSLPHVGDIFEDDAPRIITAVRTEAGALKLIAWRIGLDGTIQRKDSLDVPGTISSVRSVQFGYDLGISAVRDGDGRLKLVTWRYEP